MAAGASTGPGGGEIPNSLSPSFLASIAYSAAEISTLRGLGEYRGKQQLFARQRPEVLASLRQVALVESSESSNRLEGITADPARLEDLVLRKNEPRDRSEQEIAGYRDALSLIHESAKDMPFTVNVVRQLHTIIGRYQPGVGGTWKATDNEIVERAPDGRILRVRFKAVSAVSTPHAMDDLVARYRDAVDRLGHEPLVIVPLVILDFLCVHPFQDGNGRVARLLTLFLLYHFDYEVGRYISLERIFEETKESYYETLEASSQRWHEAAHDVGPWTRYFWGVLLRAYREFEERVGTIGAGRGSKSEQVRAAVERRIASFSISDLERECPGVSRDTIRLVLRQMREGGSVHLEGHGRGARWRRAERKERGQ
jgi:Fic family protein